MNFALCYNYNDLAKAIEPWWSSLQATAFGFFLLKSKISKLTTESSKNAPSDGCFFVSAKNLTDLYKQVPRHLSIFNGKISMEI